jgi:tetratricopeptide (TPR) repeat protein
MKRRGLLYLELGLVVVFGLVAMVGARLVAHRRVPPPTPQPGALVIHTSPVTAADYLNRAGEELDGAAYSAAIADYTRAIALDPTFAEAYNNRAYTYMTLGNYAAALSDLDQAIALRPTYVNALMNRGDIYNYYYHIDRARALADYDRVLAVDPNAARDTSVCGHRMLALHGGWNLGTLSDLPATLASLCTPTQP